MPYTSPLSIYVLWHPAFTEGETYFMHLYADLCRNVKDTLDRNIGIPIFPRSRAISRVQTAEGPFPGRGVAEGAAQPAPIVFAEADTNAVVILVDDEMFNDPSWEAYIRHLLKMPGNNRFFPIAISKYAHGFLPELAEIQYITLYGLTDDDRDKMFGMRYQRLYLSILHECCRMLLNVSPSHVQADDHPPVKLFISHAKKDGENIAIDFRNYVRAQTKLSSFFDANDIADGYLFSKEIQDALSRNAVIVVFQTDAYATREWCRREVILGKRFKTPIVVINALTRFEKRSFPYLGNVPVLRWEIKFDMIIQRALYQCLYQLYTGALLKKSVEMYFPGRKDVEFLPSSPELFNYVDILRLKRKKRLKKIYILYPDPPLGEEELSLLNDIDKGVVFLTPILLPHQNLTNGNP
jgi:hypothetical protein